MNDFAEKYKTATGKQFFLTSKSDAKVDWLCWETIGVPSDAQIERMYKRLSITCRENQIVVGPKPRVALGL